MRLWLLGLVLAGACLYCPLQVVQAFRFQHVLNKPPFQHLNTLHPLHTTDDMTSISCMSRSELGLRVLKSKPLYMAGNGPHEAQQRSSKNILFANFKQGMQKYSEGLVKISRKLFTLALVVAASVSPSTLRQASVAASTVVATLTAGPMMQANAGILKNYQSLSATQRLATTPLYFVTNSRGNSYLQEDMQTNKPEQKVVVYFMSSEDANDYLEEMSQVNSGNVNELRVMTVSMEKVLTQIQSKKQSRKLGRYDVDMIYRIQPSSRQMENADQLLAKQRDAKTSKATTAQTGSKKLAIPMFSADGLAIKRGSGETVTPHYFALEDLLEDWAKMVSAAGSERTAIPREPKVVVRDFTEVMCLAQGISKDSVEGQDFLANLLDESTVGRSTSGLTAAQIKAALQTPGIVPPRREIEMIKNYYRNEAGLKNEFSKSKLLLK